LSGLSFLYDGLATDFKNLKIITDNKIIDPSSNVFSPSTNYNLFKSLTINDVKYISSDVFSLLKILLVQNID
jgi:hypothetical protein